jgi:hypothetical protein
VWDAITGAERHAIETAGPLYRLDIDPGGSFLATAGPAGAELHDINSGESVATLVTGVETLDAEFGPNGLLATASFDGVRLWESLRGSGELIYDLNGVFSVAFDPVGTVLAMSIVEESLQGFIEIRDLGSGETIRPVTSWSRRATTPRQSSGIPPPSSRYISSKGTGQPS